VGNEGSTLVPRGTPSTGLAWATVGVAGGAVGDTIGVDPDRRNRPERVKAGWPEYEYARLTRSRLGLPSWLRAARSTASRLPGLGARRTPPVSSAARSSPMFGSPIQQVAGCTKPDSPARQPMHRKRRSSPVGFLVLCSLGAIH